MKQEKLNVLLVANVAKEHVLKFHLPTIRQMRELGWNVDVACAGDEPVPYCNHQFKMSYKRSPFSFKTIKGIMELKKIIDSNNYDVVYCHTPVGGPVARIAARKMRTRKMRTKREDVTWFFNNDVERNLVYDLIDTPGDPYPRSCLNVYGKKMVQDITTNSLIRNADGTRNLWENYYQEGELNNHDRFNYTGL